jgi:hypothetical protein
MSWRTKASRSAGGQRLEHDQEREPDRVGEQRLLLGVEVVGTDDRLGDPRVGRVLAPGAPGPQHIQADTPDHGRQPAAEVVDRRAVAAAEPQPGLLDRVVALVERAEHAVGHPPQVRPVLLELFCQKVVLAHVTSPPSRPSRR